MTPTSSSDVRSIDRLDTPIDPQGHRIQELETELNQILDMARGDVFVKPKFEDVYGLDIEKSQPSYLQEGPNEVATDETSELSNNPNFSREAEATPKNEFDDELQAIQDYIYSSSKKLLLRQLFISWRESAHRIKVLNASSDDYRKHKILAKWYMTYHNARKLSIDTTLVARQIERNRALKVLQSWRERSLTHRRAMEQAHKHAKAYTKAAVIELWRIDNKTSTNSKKTSQETLQNHLKRKYFEIIVFKHRLHEEQVRDFRQKLDKERSAEVLKSWELESKVRKLEKKTQKKLMANCFQIWKVELLIARCQRINNNRIAHETLDCWRDKLHNLSPLYSELQSVEYGMKKAKFAAFLNASRKHLQHIEKVKALDPELIAQKHRMASPFRDWRAQLRIILLDRLGEETKERFEKMRAAQILKTWRKQTTEVAKMYSGAAYDGEKHIKTQFLSLLKNRLTKLKSLNSLVDPTDRLKFVAMEAMKESFNRVADMNDQATDYHIQFEAATGFEVLRIWQERASAVRRLQHLATSRLNAAMKRERNDILLHWRLNTRPQTRAPPSSQSRSPSLVELSPRLRQKLVSQSPRFALYKTPRKLRSAEPTRSLPESAPARFTEKTGSTDAIRQDEEEEEVYTPTRPRRREEQTLRLPQV